MYKAKPDIKRWIIDQVEAGMAAPAVLQGMQASGWTEQDALEVLEFTLQEYLDQSRGQASAEHSKTNVSTSAIAQPQQAESLPPASPVPQPVLPAAGNTVELDGQRIHVLASLENPCVVIFENVFSQAECDELVALAKPRIKRSLTVDGAGDGEEVNEVRTSSGMFFDRDHEPLVQRLDQRMADLLGWPVENGESLQVLNYQPSAEYLPHYDYFDPQASGTAAQLKRGGQRVATMLVYLNNCEAGGATIFPDVGLSVFPKPGLGVYFAYDKPHESTLSLHGGAPVIQGEKWVATRWMRESVFQ